MEHFWNGSFQNNYQDYLTLSSDVYDMVETSLDEMKTMGISTVRLPVCFDVWMEKEDDLLKSPYFELLDQIVEWTRFKGLNLIIDYHHGGLIGLDITEEASRLIRHWELIASRYQDTNPDQVFFDLYNEPHDISQFHLERTMRLLIQQLRAIVPNHTFLLGGLEYNNLRSLAQLEPFADQNIIYAFHFYEPFIFTHQGTSWVGSPVATTDIPFPFESSAMPAMNVRVEDTWGEDAWKKYAVLGKPYALFSQIEVARSWSLTNNKPVICSEWGSFYAINDEDRCKYTETMVNIFEELEMPNLFWDWNQNFSLVSAGENQLSNCMKAAWEPEPFFEDIPENLESNIFVYPNPGSDYIFVNVDDIDERISLKIFNSMGGLMYEKNLASHRMVVPIVDYSTGVYFVECIGSDGHRYIDKLFVE